MYTSNVAHTVKNIAEILKEQLLDIKNKVICAVTDNGANMVNAVNLLGVRHLPCFTHSLQLVNSAIAANKNPTIFPTTLQAQPSTSTQLRTHTSSKTTVREMPQTRADRILKKAETVTAKVFIEDEANEIEK